MKTLARFALALSLTFAPVAIVAAQDNGNLPSQFSREACNTLHGLMWDLDAALMRLDDQGCWTPTCVGQRAAIYVLKGKISSLMTSGNCGAYDRPINPTTWTPPPGTLLH